jgi:hypothetical protein
MSADQAPTSEPAQTSAPAQSSEPTSPPAGNPEDENKRRFREALEAKKNHRGENHIDEDGKPHVHAHGPVDSKRVFRRKTG